MKKIISLLLVIFTILSMLFILTGCEDGGTKTDKLTATLSGENYGFKVEGTFPAHEETDENGNTIVVADYKLLKPGKYGDNIAMANDKVELGFNITSYSYNTYAKYKEKYGNKETSFANYLEFLKDPDFDDVKADQKNYELTTVSGIEAIKYKYSGRMIYVLNLQGEKASKQRCTLTVYSLDDKVSVTDLIEDEEIKTLINSFVISGK